MMVLLILSGICGVGTELYAMRCNTSVGQLERDDATIRQLRATFAIQRKQRAARQ